MKVAKERFVARCAIGFVLAFLLAAGVKLSADSGGFYCCYGSCALLYDCVEGNEDWNYSNDGNGECTITLDVPCDNYCYVYLDVTDPNWTWLDPGHTGGCPGDGESWTFRAGPILPQ